MGSFSWVHPECDIWVRPMSKNVFEFIGIKNTTNQFVVCKQIVDISTIGLFKINMYLNPYGYDSLQDLRTKCGSNSELTYATCVFKETKVDNISDKLCFIDSVEAAKNYIENNCVV